MGYSYAINPITGRENLVCDSCGDYGGVKKKQCPFGYCQPTALCPKCDKKYAPTWREIHEKRGCDVSEENFQQTENKKKQLLSKGKSLRVAALSHSKNGQEVVKVIFRDGSGKESAYLMKPTVYRSIPLMTPATPEDYRKYGSLIRAKNTDIYYNG